MRAAAVAAAAVLAMTGAAMAQPVSTERLAAGEVLLELNATGTAVTRADVAVIQATIFGSGDSEEAARREAEAALGSVTRIARAAGVAPADIEAEPIGASPNFAVREAPVPPEEAGEAAAAEAGATELPPPVPEPRASASGTVRIRMRNVAGVDALEDALEDGGAALGSSTTYYLDDSTAARRQARGQALAAARADAEAYAAAIGLRVLRVGPGHRATGLRLLRADDDRRPGDAAGKAADRK